MSDDQHINCTILTLRSENVMVPSASIAEIISARDAVRDPDMPDWYLGKMDWRGEKVPLVSYEAAAGAEARKVNMNTQVAVLYAVSKGAKYPYIGLVISGVPHTSKLARDQIITDPAFMELENPHPMVAQKARINGAAVSILDVEEIEHMIFDLDAAN